ncbi:unnamed protein product [Schistocephalus solidus]|uniref:Endo/exonuclease/phosphatase domain-containing protein n=1 Tax=Schistocephalus solidus TaxID=70667 RepID=A0A183TMD7_SCHSO|nr:unnamed protein product [Schistocephalus solidus]
MALGTLNSNPARNAPVAASSWYPTLTCGSSKLGSSQRATVTTGGLNQVRVSGVVCASTLGMSNFRTSELIPLKKSYGGGDSNPAALVSPLTLAAWNVRSLLDNPRRNQPERRTALVAQELARDKVDIVALSETRFSELRPAKGRATRRWCCFCHPERYRGTYALSAAGYQ